jgi:hypothetical protein
MFSPPSQFTPQQQFPSQLQEGLKDFDLEEDHNKETVQETQQVQDESDSTDDMKTVLETKPPTKKPGKKGKLSTRVKRQDWTSNQILNLEKSRVYVSENPKIGDA